MLCTSIFSLLFRCLSQFEKQQVNLPLNGYVTCFSLEGLFKLHQNSGPIFQGNKFREAEDLFATLLNKEASPLKPDQKMFHMMIYMHKKAGNYGKARQVFSLMAEHGVQPSTVTYNSLMSFETNYKEVAKTYDQVIRGVCV